MANYQMRRPKIAEIAEIAERDGLSVKVSTTGKVFFVVRVRYDANRNSKRVFIGSYRRMSLQSVRTETERLPGRLDQQSAAMLSRALS